ncbi:MAG: flagellar motor protein MotB [Bradymonadia bacterium]
MERRPPESGESWLLTYADLITNLLIFFVMLLAASTFSESKMQEIKENLSGATSPTSLSTIQKEIDKKIQSQGLEALVATDLTREGLELSLNSGLVFASGNAEIREAEARLLDSMLETLVPYEKRYRFAVEGHTDSRPISGGRFFSNWELSTARANAVRHRLESMGVAASKIKVEGYADTRPLPEKALEGLTEEERLARHRRVVLRVY